jgi:hypothetical protein
VAGGALSVEMDPATGVIVAVLGSRFFDDPQRRRRWLARERSGAREWARRIGFEVGW